MQKPDPISARYDQATLDRLEAEAARRGWSRSQTIVRAVEIGLVTLESQVSLPFAEVAS